MGDRDVNNIRITMVTIYEIARTRFTVQYCIKCLFDQFFQLWMISKNFRWYRKDQNECYWRCQSYWDDWSHSLEKYFSGKGQKWVIFHKNQATFVVWYFILRKITRFCAIWKKIYLYTSASAFSEILQRLKQNSKTSCDLGKLPTEVGVKILKCLDATGRSREQSESFYVGETDPTYLRFQKLNGFWLKGKFGFCRRQGNWEIDKMSILTINLSDTRSN